MGPKEYGKMMKIIQTLEDGSVPAKEATNWRIEGQKKIITRKEYQRLVNKFEMEGFMAQKVLRNLAKEMNLTEEKLSKEEGDAVREYKATHEENFLSSWLREDEKRKGRRKLVRRMKNKGVKRGRERRREPNGESQKKKGRFVFCGGL